MRHRTRTLIGTAVTLGLAASLLTATAPAASAAELIPENELQSMTVDPTTRTGLDAGTSSLLYGPGTVTTTTGCPENFRGMSRTFMVAPDGTETTAATSRTNVTAAAYGLQGNPMTLAGARASNWSGFDAVKLPDGINKFVVTCDPVGTVASAPIGDSKYFVAYIQVNRAAESWTQVAAPTMPVVKETPTIAFTGATANADGSVALTATVSGSAGVAADATGVVAFSGSYPGLATPVTADVVATVGVATWTTPVLEAGKTYAFTAAYKANGDLKYNDSATSATTTVTTVAEPAPPQNTDITVTIPAAATGLKFTITPGDAALGTPTLDGTSYVATGALGTATVSDSRATRTAWTLNGKAGAFVNSTDATKTIAASTLGWAPALVGTANAGTAGTAVVAGVDGGLSTDKPLAQAAAGVATALTTVNAAFTLKAPVETVGGDYRAKLTLTLI